MRIAFVFALIAQSTMTSSGSIAQGAPGFMFRSGQVVSTTDAEQYVTIGEKISLQALQKRMHSYKVEVRQYDDGGASNSAGLLLRSGDLEVHLAYNWDANRVDYAWSWSKGVFDSAGNVIGDSVGSAVGSTAYCEKDEHLECKSFKIKGLFYQISTEGKCDPPEQISSSSYKISPCNIIYAFVLKK